MCRLYRYSLDYDWETVQISQWISMFLLRNRLDTANMHGSEDNRRQHALISTVYPVSCIAIRAIIELRSVSGHTVRCAIRYENILGMTLGIQL